MKPFLGRDTRDLGRAPGPAQSSSPIQRGESDLQPSWRRPHQGDGARRSVGPNAAVAREGRSTKGEATMQGPPQEARGSKRHYGEAECSPTHARSGTERNGGPRRAASSTGT